MKTAFFNPQKFPELTRYIDSGDEEWRHYPLQQIFPTDVSKALQEHLGEDHEIQNIIHSTKINAEHFLKALRENGLEDRIKDCVHFVVDQESFDYLNDQGFAVLLPPASRIIDLMEFMLRLKRTGLTLCPGGDPKEEEIPDFLHELGIDFIRIQVSETQPADSEMLRIYHTGLKETPPTTILTHSETLPAQLNALFPEMPDTQIKWLPVNEDVRQKLVSRGFEPLDSVWK